MKFVTDNGINKVSSYFFSLRYSSNLSTATMTGQLTDEAINRKMVANHFDKCLIV